MGSAEVGGQLVDRRKAREREREDGRATLDEMD